VQLRVAGDSADEVSAVALLDTGSNMDFISRRLAESLMSLGAEEVPQHTPVQLGGTDSTVRATSVLRAVLSAAGKVVTRDFVVLDTDYELILGYSTLKSLGLVQVNQDLDQSLEALLADYECCRYLSVPI
jgi:predicted aspartyl protease